MTTANQPVTAKYTLLKYPDPKLKEISIDCTEDDIPLIKEAYVDMSKIVNDYNAAGIAAIQVGIPKRFCLLKDTSNVHLMINPVLTVDGEQTKIKEGCLSLPYFHEFIVRYPKVTVYYKDENWIDRTAELEGIEAQCLQHEIDHFNGTTQLDKVSLMVKQMYLKKAKKKGIL